MAAGCGDSTTHTPADAALPAPAITVTPTSGLVTTEAGGTATFTIVLSAPPTADVIIGLSSSNLSEGTVAPDGVTFTADNWNAPQTVTVKGVDDDRADGAQAYLIVTAPAVSADAAWAGLDADDVAVSNSDNDSPGITVTPKSGLHTTEAGGSDSFTIVLNSQPTADVTIALSSSSPEEGTASPASLTFTHDNWNAPQKVTVTGVDDAVADGAHIYQIVTAPAVSSDAGYAGLDADDVSVTNSDDDSPGITVTPTMGLVTTEAGGSDSFTIVLNSQPTANVTIALSSSDLGEGTVSPASITFTTVNWNAPRTVTVTGVDDSVADGSQPYKIVTAAATSADPGYQGLDADDVSVSNTDDDSPGVTVTPTSGLATTESGGSDSFTIVLNSQPTADVTIALSSSKTAEGTVSPASVTFTTDNWNAPRIITVTGVDDSVADGNQPYTIVTAAATSADTGYDGLDADDVAVTNIDNDSAGFIVTPTSGLTTGENGDTATFTVVLTSQPTGDVTVALSSSKPGEGTIDKSSLTFTVDDWNAPQLVTITGVDDHVADGNQPYTIVTAPATSGDAGYNGLDADDVAVTNIDNDTAGITVTPTSGLVTSEAGGSDSFTIVLNSQPTADVTIALSSSKPGEGTPQQTSVTFTSSNWNVAQTVTVVGADDAIADGNQVYDIVTAPATSSDGGYAGLDADDVEITNVDNDSAGITVTPTDGLFTSEFGDFDTFTIVLNSQPTADVTIALSSSDLTEGTVSPPSVTFTAANWNVPQTVTVTGVDDTILDGDQPYTIITAPATSADTGYDGLDAADVGVINVDNEKANIFVQPSKPLVTTEAGGTATFTMRLTVAPAADVTCTLHSNDLTEGTVSPTTVVFTPANGTAKITITVTGVDDNIVDGDQRFRIITDACTSSDATYNNVNPKDVKVVNQDND